jgi:hypothetical protein
LNKIRAIIILILTLNLLACTVFLGTPKERTLRFSDVELCTLLADKTFKFHSEWLWAISDEIKKRELDQSIQCEDTYKRRMGRFMQKIKAKPLTFKEALNYTNNH